MATETTTETSQERKPWEPAVPGLKNVINRVNKLSKNTDLFVPVQGNTSRDGIQSTIDLARQGSAALPVLQDVVGGSAQGFGTGLGQLQANASGSNLQGNPYLKSVLDRAASETANDVNSQFSLAGRYGSGAHAGEIAQQVGALRNQAEMGNYNTERANQVAAGNTLYQGGFTGSGQAGEIDRARLFTPQMLGLAGSAQDAQATAQKQAPLTATSWQAGLLNPIAAQGGTTSGTQTQTVDNPLGTVVGGLSTGLGLMSGVGTAGGLSGLFSNFMR